jgi:polar amino acid transport system permease protein
MGNRTAILAICTFLAGLSIATFSEFRLFLPSILQGGLVTLQVSVLSFLLMVLSAFAAAIAKLAPFAPVRWLAATYIEIFRGTSLIVQLFWFYYVLPEFGLTLSPVMAAVLGIGLNFGAYGSEVVRGGILSVQKEQWEAATALNLPPVRTLIRIVLPQTLIVIVPPMANLTIELIKATSIVSIVTLVDITFAAVQQNQLYYRTIEIFMITLTLYYCLSLLVRFSSAMVELKLQRYTADTAS